MGISSGPVSSTPVASVPNNVAAAGGFQAAWAIGSNVVLQPGLR